MEEYLNFAIEIAKEAEKIMHKSIKNDKMLMIVDKFPTKVGSTQL